MPHAAVQTLYMKPLFTSHCLSLAHPLQLSSWSMQTVEQSPHASGSFITASGLFRHSPASDQISHCVEFWSAHLTTLAHAAAERARLVHDEPGFLKL